MDSPRAGFGAASGSLLSSMGHDFLTMFTSELDCELMKQFGNGNCGPKESNEVHVKTLMFLMMRIIITD